MKRLYVHWYIWLQREWFKLLILFINWWFCNFNICLSEKRPDNYQQLFSRGAISMGQIHGLISQSIRVTFPCSSRDTARGSWGPLLLKSLYILSIKITIMCYHSKVNAESVQKLSFSLELLAMTLCSSFEKNAIGFCKPKKV